VRALRSGSIAGAGLDVFTEEPLPSTSPYYELENAIVTPHVSGYTPAYFDKSIALITDNLRRMMSGQTLRNVVIKQICYVEE
jgi:D-2-hydroxyacid dehydrogenase (NADP+)